VSVGKPFGKGGFGLARTALNIISVLVLLTLFSSFALAVEPCVKRNVCDAGYDGRFSTAKSNLDLFYNGRALLLFSHDGSAPLRYEAALFKLSSGKMADIEAANQLLAKEFTYDATTTTKSDGSEALFLAWTLKKYGGELTAANKAAIEARLANYEPPLPPAPQAREPERFAGLVADYLANGDHATDLKSELRLRGDKGWAMAYDATAMATIVDALAALLDQASDDELKVLAEMHLDLLFARQAVLGTGAYGGVLGGATFASNPYDPSASAWLGWDALLFSSDGQGSFTKPSLLIVRYCAHGALLALRNERENNLVITESFPEYSSSFSSWNGKAFAFTNDKYLLAGTLDVDGFDASFLPETGYAVKASLRIPETPAAFILFTTITSDRSDAAGPDAAVDDGSRLFTTKNLVLGQLGGDSCREPHVYVSEAFFSAGGGAVTGPINYPVAGASHRRGIALLASGDQLFALQFLGGAGLSSFNERYAPLSKTVFNSVETGGGAVIFPEDPSIHGLVAFERVDPSRFPDTLDPGEDPDAVIAYVKENTEFRGEGNSVVYESRLNSKNMKTYRYIPQTSFTIDGVSPTTGSAPLRVRNEDGTYSYLDQTASLWTLQGRLSNGNYRGETLSFHSTGAAMKTTTPETTYACSASVPPSEETPSVETPDERLAFLAASLLQDLDGAYVLACGPPSEVLPNSEPLFTSAGELVLGACVLQHDDVRTVGLVYNEEYATTGVVPTLLQNLRQYFPFASTSQSPPAPTLCDAKLDNPPASNLFAYVKCGSFATGGTYGSLSVFVNPESGTIVFSNDANPFTDAGLLDGVIDFFTGLFGGATSGAVNPATTGAFTNAYFFTDDANPRAAVKASRSSANVEILFENFAASVEPLAAAVGSYRAGGYTQLITGENVAADAWRALTTALRVVAQGEPTDFTTVCGDGTLQYGEACDLGPSGGTLHACTNGQGSVRCTAACTIDESACIPSCVDADGDGFYPVAGCNDKPLDCYDADPATVFGIFDGSAQVSCVGAPCGTVPYTACPQCVFPGAEENCGDLVDNNCVIEECPTNTSGGSVDDADYTCGDRVSPSCAYVCNATVVAQTPDASGCASTDDCTDGKTCVKPTGSSVGTCVASSSGGGDGGCFAAGASVLMADGSPKPIEEIRVGDKVFGADESGARVANTVTTLFVHEGPYALLRINDVLLVTPEHLVKTSSGWIPAGELVVGETLYAPDGALVPVTSITSGPIESVVYNLETVPSHTYYAGGVLVHNLKDDGGANEAQ